jgi:hypothetical protein
VEAQLHLPGNQDAEYRKRNGTEEFGDDDFNTVYQGVVGSIRSTDQ